MPLLASKSSREIPSVSQNHMVQPAHGRGLVNGSQNHDIKDPGQGMGADPVNQGKCRHSALTKRCPLVEGPS